MAFSTQDIPPEMSDAWRDVFNQFADAEDEIAIKDVGKAIRAAGQCPTQEQLVAMIEEVQNEPDSESTTKVTWTQYERLMVSCLNEYKTEEELREALRVFDKDQSGYLPLTEFRYFMTTVGDTLDGDEMLELIAEAGASGCFDITGTNLSIDEFVKKIVPPLPGQ